MPLLFCCNQIGIWGFSSAYLFRFERNFPNAETALKHYSGLFTPYLENMVIISESSKG